VLSDALKLFEMPRKDFQYWCFTTSDFSLKIEANADIRFVVEQDEHPPDVTKHRQGYVEFAGRLSKKAACQALGFPDIRGKKSDAYYHAEPRKGTKAQAAAYCCSTWFCSTCHVGDHKEVDLGIWDYTGCPEKGTTQPIPTDKEPNPVEIEHVDHEGYKPKFKAGPAKVSGTPVREGRGGSNKGGEGSGGVEREIIEAIRAGTPRAEIFERFAGWASRYHAWIDKAMGLYTQKRAWKPYVVWLHGHTGSGKSRLAAAVCASSTYTKNCDHRWWDGYSGQRVVVLEELRKQFCFSTLLAWFDRRPVTLEFKGGCTQLAAYVMIVTSSMSHREVWKELRGEENERLDQLTRRIDLELDMGKATLEEQKQALWRIRQACHRLEDPANHDREDLFGEWALGSEPIHPLFQPRTDTTKLCVAPPPGLSPEASPVGSRAPAKKRARVEKSRSPRRLFLSEKELMEEGVFEDPSSPPDSSGSQ
jgi:hypothetical protein